MRHRRAAKPVLRVDAGSSRGASVRHSHTRCPNRYTSCTHSTQQRGAGSAAPWLGGIAVAVTPACHTECMPARGETLATSKHHDPSRDTFSASSSAHSSVWPGGIAAVVMRLRSLLKATCDSMAEERINSFFKPGAVANARRDQEVATRARQQAWHAPKPACTANHRSTALQ